LRLFNHSWLIFLEKEWLGVTSGHLFWGLLLVQTLLTGSTYNQAVHLYAQASEAALVSPSLATALSPLEGIFVPTLGSLYLGFTLLFPFIIIQQWIREHTGNTFILLLQTRQSLVVWLITKTTILVLVQLVMLIIPCSALLFWLGAGGHIAIGELFILITGYILYAWLMIGVASLSAVLMDSVGSAAIIVLSIVLGSWTLDFVTVGEEGIWYILSSFSLTTILRSFESGLLNWVNIVGLGLAGITALSLTGIVLYPQSLRVRLFYATFILMIFIGFTTLVSVFTSSIDMTENQRHSFAPAQEKTLTTLKQPLHIIINLTPDDPRFMDFERNVLNKLKRNISKLHIKTASKNKGYFLAEENYGKIKLSYAGKEVETRSTSPREILDLLWKIAEVEIPSSQTIHYSGYPLVASSQLAEIWFYFLLPVLIGIGWRQSRY